MKEKQNMFLADRSSSICHYQSKIGFNRTRSNYHCHDAWSKPLLSSLSTHYCDHCHPPPPPRISSPPVQTNPTRRHLFSATTTTSSNSSLLDDEQPIRRISHGDDIDCTTKLTCTVNTTDGYRRRKSASLNSPANSGKTKPKPKIESI